MDVAPQQQSAPLVGQVWVASKPGRGSPAAFPNRAGFTRVDVTSGSTNLLWLGSRKVHATELSPLLLGPVADCNDVDAVRFENLWQYRKVYAQLGHWDEVRERPTLAWDAWRAAGYAKLTDQRKGVRTPPEVSALKAKHRAGTIASWAPRCAWWEGEPLSYVEARKRIYVPVYARLAAATDAYRALQAQLAAGKSLLILDLDGPPLSAYPGGMHVTEENVARALNDPAHPFGHGYVVAALLAGVDLEALCRRGGHVDETSTKRQRIAE